MCFVRKKQKKFQQFFEASTTDLMSLRDKLMESGCGWVAIESTRIYWMLVWHVMKFDFELKWAKPYFINQLPSRKSDTKEAEWIGECL